MSATKDAPQVAREITKRLLPKVTAAHTTYQERCERLRTHKARRVAAAEQLAQITGLSGPARWGRSTTLGLHWTGAPRPAPAGLRAVPPRAHVEVTADDRGESVAIALSGLSVEQAERALRGLLEPDPAPIHPATDTA